MKKFLLIIMSVVLITSCIAGCGKKADIHSATLVGYDSSSFEDTMESYFEDVATEEVADLSYGWKNGWVGNDAPDSEILNSNEKAMTYIVSVNLDYDDETETNRMIFYMVHNTKENTLSVHGGSFDEDGDIYPMSLSEARSDLEYIFDEYN